MKYLLSLIVLVLVGCAAIVEPIEEGCVGQCPEISAAHIQYCTDVEGKSTPFTSCHPPPADFISCWPWEGSGSQSGDQCCCRTDTCVDG